MVKLVVSELVDQGKDLLLNKNKPSEAADVFNFLFNSNPESYEYAYYLGCCYNKLDLDALSIACFKDSIAKSPKFAEAWSNMGFAYFKLQERDMARECWMTAVSLSEEPDFAEVRTEDWVTKQRAEFLVNLASTFVANGTPESALELLNKSLEIYPTNNARWNKGLALLEMGQYEKGWQEYEYGERLEGDNQRSYHKKDQSETPIWTGPDPDKKPTVVVYGEQGIGDELMFASIIPDVKKDCELIFEAHPRLADMFRDSFPDIPIYGTRKDKRLSWPAWTKVDAKISIGSLCKFYRNKTEDFPGTPYVVPNHYLVEHYKRKLADLSDRPKIGVSWKGGIKKTGKNHRVIPMDMLKTLFELDADFISLQYDENAQHEVDKFNESTGFFMHHWPFVIDNYDHTAAMIKNLDMIISVPQSVVHLAGAIGVPTIQLCPIHALWQMGVRGQNMPWYNSVINIWQEVADDWSGPLKFAKHYFTETRTPNEPYKP